jgi:cytochrome c
MVFVALALALFVGGVVLLAVGWITRPDRPAPLARTSTDSGLRPAPVPQPVAPKAPQRERPALPARPEPAVPINSDRPAPRSQPDEVQRPPAEPQPQRPFDVQVVVARLATADVERGESEFRVCRVCHKADRSGSHTIGPNLWGVVGRRPASREGYAYSQSLAAKGGTWSYAELARYLHDPRGAVPGNRMAFRGIVDETKVANLIAYMRTLSDAPPPLPAARR